MVIDYSRGLTHEQAWKLFAIGDEKRKKADTADVRYNVPVVVEEEVVERTEKVGMFKKKTIKEIDYKPVKKGFKLGNTMSPEYSFSFSAYYVVGKKDSLPIEVSFDAKTLLPLTNEISDFEDMKTLIGLDPRFIQTLNPSLINKDQYSELLEESRKSAENILKYQAEYNEPDDEEESNRFIDESVEATQLFINKYMTRQANQIKMNKLIEEAKKEA